MGWSGCVSGVRDVWRRAREAFRHMPLLFFTSVALLLLRRANNNTCSSRRLSPQHPFCTRVCLNLTYSDLAPGRAVPPFLPSSLSSTLESPTRIPPQTQHKNKNTTRPLPPRWGAPRFSCDITIRLTTLIITPRTFDLKENTTTTRQHQQDLIVLDHAPDWLTVPGDTNLPSICSPLVCSSSVRTPTHTHPDTQTFEHSP